MKRRMKRKVKMKKWVKIFITIFLLLTSVQLYYDLALLGEQENTAFDEVMLILGWTWIIFGQIITLHFIWE